MDLIHPAYKDYRGQMASFLQDLEQTTVKFESKVKSHESFFARSFKVRHASFSLDSSLDLGHVPQVLS